MGSKEYIQFCKEQVVEYFNSRADKTDKNGSITTDDVFVVCTVRRFRITRRCSARPFQMACITRSRTTEINGKPTLTPIRNGRTSASTFRR